MFDREEAYEIIDDDDDIHLSTRTYVYDDIDDDDIYQPEPTFNERFARLTETDDWSGPQPEPQWFGHVLVDAQHADAKKNLTDYEPDPIHNDGPSMHDLVIDDIWKWMPYYTSVSELDSFEKVTESVIEDFKERKKFGLDKYKTILQAHNGRDALIDAYQEVQDLLVYLKQAMCEDRKKVQSFEGIYKLTLRVCVEIKRYMIKSESISFG
jgi:hypothetical protein